MLDVLKTLFGRTGEDGLIKRPLPVAFEKIGEGWLSANLRRRIAPPQPQCASLIEARARLTEGLGPLPLWQGYRTVHGYPADTEGSRSSNQVRSAALMGRLYSWLVTQRKPEVIVEFGTAFGVSGMYWLAGLEGAERGKLFTFEPNAEWAAVADANLRAVSRRFHLTVGTFEDNAASVLRETSVDIAFVDAIHTSDFVLSQYRILKEFLAERALVLFDDIQFSDDMERCWSTIAHAPEVVSSARIGGRLGIIEVRS